jgi:hypothetical protein
MKKSFHETLTRDDEEIPSERSFARVMGIAFYVLAAIAWWHRQSFAWVEVVLAGIGTAFLLIGYTKPLWLRPLNKAWAKLGHVLFKITNPIIMALLYTITIIPMGLLLRLFGKDPLKRTFDAQAPSYWVTREFQGPAPETITRQF